MKLVFWMGGWRGKGGGGARRKKKKKSTVPFTHFWTMRHATKTIAGLIPTPMTCGERDVYARMYVWPSTIAAWYKKANELQMNPFAPPFRRKAFWMK